MIKVTESRPQTEKNSVFSLLYLEVQTTQFHTVLADSWIVVGKKYWRKKKKFMFQSTAAPFICTHHMWGYFSVNADTTDIDH